jgi:SAM-dependent methyltransferase
MSITTKVPYDFNPDLRHPSFIIRNGLYQAVKKYAPRLSGKLIDLGCGAKPYRSLFNVESYIGVDYASEGHPHDNEDIDVYYDGITLPFPNQHFDAVFSSEVFEHVFNLEQLLPEVNRVMKNGAKILVTCPFVICEHEVPNDYARYTSFAIKHLFEKNGFRVLAYEKTGTHVTAIMQLRLMYIHQHIMPFFRKIPILRSGLRLVVYGGLNTCALIKNKLLPKKTDLYLNNVILCEKI